MTRRHLGGVERAGGSIQARLNVQARVPHGAYENRRQLSVRHHRVGDEVVGRAHAIEARRRIDGELHEGW